MADGPGRQAGRRDSLAELLTTLWLTGWALAQALLFTGIGLSLFLVAFLGYFTLPFLFLAGALLILATGSAARTIRRVRGRAR